MPNSNPAFYLTQVLKGWWWQLASKVGIKSMRKKKICSQMGGLCVCHLKIRTCWSHLSSSRCILTSITCISFDGLRDAGMMGGRRNWCNTYLSNGTSLFSQASFWSDVYHLWCVTSLYYYLSPGSYRLCCLALVCCLRAGLLKFQGFTYWYTFYWGHEHFGTCWPKPGIGHILRQFMTSLSPLELADIC